MKKITNMVVALCLLLVLGGLYVVLSTVIFGGLTGCANRVSKPTAVSLKQTISDAGCLVTLCCGLDSSGGVTCYVYECGCQGGASSCPPVIATPGCLVATYYTPGPTPGVSASATPEITPTNTPIPTVVPTQVGTCVPEKLRSSLHKTTPSLPAGTEDVINKVLGYIPYAPKIRNPEFSYTEDIRDCCLGDETVTGGHKRNQGIASCDLWADEKPLGPGVNISQNLNLGFKKVSVKGIAGVVVSLKSSVSFNAGEDTSDCSGISCGFYQMSINIISTIAAKIESFVCASDDEDGCVGLNVTPVALGGRTSITSSYHTPSCSDGADWTIFNDSVTLSLKISISGVIAHEISYVIYSGGVFRQ